MSGMGIHRGLGFALLAACAGPVAAPPAGRASLSLVFASRGEGELEPCG